MTTHWPTCLLLIMASSLWRFCAAACILDGCGAWLQQVDFVMNEICAEGRFRHFHTCCVQESPVEEEWTDAAIPVVGPPSWRMSFVPSSQDSCRHRLALALYGSKLVQRWNFVAAILLDGIGNATRRPEMTRVLAEVLQMVFSEWTLASKRMDQDVVVLVQHHRRQRSRSQEAQRRQRRRAWLRPATEGNGGRGSNGRRPAQANEASARAPAADRTATTRASVAANASGPTRTCSWVRVPRRWDRAEPASSSTRRPPAAASPAGRADGGSGVLTGERQSDADPELYL